MEDSEENNLQSVKEGNETFDLNLDMNENVNDATRPDLVKQCQPKEEANFIDDKGISKQLEDGGYSPARKSFPSSDELQRRVQQQIDDINAKRKRDTDLLNDFRKGLEMQVSKTCGAIEEAIVKSYEDKSHVIESKLQEIFAALERIRQLEDELKNFKKTLGLLYTDMQNV
ncbi:uncharacterized protein LOC110252691 [Exaiptasia diaphana]|uniref:Uncharacterized protein n=1 Tax=Exaiptasia diaphana TaxID=2652724 RepID=A0A913Y5P0_EXADI|nr:uncharacterized protein LOC110252691 [Exaiptasia diaphana]